MLSEIEKLLFSAAVRGNTVLIQFCIDAGADINAADNSGDTALIYAARHGSIDAIKKLLSLGANTESSYPFHETALIIAARYGNIPIVKALLAAGANVNTIDRDKYSALEYAAINRHIDVIEALLAAGANVIDNDAIDYTASIKNTYHLVKIMLERGATLYLGPYEFDEASDLDSLRSPEDIELNNLAKTIFIAWKNIIKQPLSKDEIEFLSSGGYDKAFATKHLESRAAHVVNKLKAGTPLTDDEIAFSNNPVCKDLAAFQEFKENSQFIASTATLFGNYIAGDALNMIFEYLPKKEGFEKQAVLISSIKRLLDVYEVNINGEKRFLRQKEMEAKDPKALEDLYYYLTRSLQGEERDVSFETGEEITISSLLAKFKSAKVIHSSVMYQEKKGVEALLEDSPKISPINPDSGSKDTNGKTSDSTSGDSINLYRKGAIAGSLASGVIKLADDYVTGENPDKTVYECAVETFYSLAFSAMGMAVNVAVSKSLAQYEVNPINQAISSQLLSQLALNGLNGLSPENGNYIFLNTAASFHLYKSGVAEAYPTTTGFILTAGPDLLQLACDLMHKACEMSGICEAEQLQGF